MNRCAGVLMHITSLPSPYGIGTMGKEAYAFVDFLKEAGQTYWQILPIGPTGYGNSPYQSLSSYAGNPYLIDLDLLCEEGLLEKEELEDIDWSDDTTLVDYGKQYNNRYKVLRKACNRFVTKDPTEYYAFLKEESSWLKDYAIFMAIKDDRKGESWTNWPKELRNHRSEEVRQEALRLTDSVMFYTRMQYFFFKQLKALKKYANENGIQIIGDLPFYIASDSSDVWVDPEQFVMDENTYQMKEVSGMPCDDANPNGQKWGNPLFDWERMRNDGYTWWINRVKHVLKGCDVLRIDHFQGYHSFYAVPNEGEAKDGHWVKGPGLEPFHKLEETIGKTKIIVEDLGYLNDEFKQMIKDSGYPGMRILEYAFDKNDTYSLYMPFNHEKNSVVYTGTHDNHTILSWSKIEKDRCERMCKYLGTDGKDVVDTMLRCMYASPSDVAISQIQDWLKLDDSSRMNDPSNYQNAWRFRVKKGSLNTTLAKKMKEMMLMYARNNWENS